MVCGQNILQIYDHTGSGEKFSIPNVIARCNFPAESSSFLLEQGFVTHNLLASLLLL